MTRAFSSRLLVAVTLFIANKDYALGAHTKRQVTAAEQGTVFTSIHSTMQNHNKPSYRRRRLGAIVVLASCGVLAVGASIPPRAITFYQHSYKAITYSHEPSYPSSALDSNTLTLPKEHKPKLRAKPPCKRCQYRAEEIQKLHNKERDCLHIIHELEQQCKDKDAYIKELELGLEGGKDFAKLPESEQKRAWASAVGKGDLEFISKALPQVANPIGLINMVFQDQGNVLHVAVGQGNMPLVKYIVQVASDRKKELTACLSLYDRYERLPLHVALEQGNIPMIEYLAETHQALGLDSSIPQHYEAIIEILRQPDILSPLKE